MTWPENQGIPSDLSELCQIPPDTILKAHILIVQLLIKGCLGSSLCPPINSLPPVLCILCNMNNTPSYGRDSHAILSTVTRSLQIWGGNQKKLWLVTDPISTNWEWGPWSAHRQSTAHCKIAAVWDEALSIFFDTREKPVGYFEIAAVKWISWFCHFHAKQELSQTISLMNSTEGCRYWLF